MASNLEVTFRPYRPGDEFGINDGFNRVFGLHRSMPEWRWKFAVDTTRPWIMVAIGSEGRIVAYYGALEVPMRLGGQLLRVGQPVDVYSVPEVRGTRVFSGCYEAFCSHFGGLADLPLIYGFPGGQHYEMGFKLLHYVRLRPVGYWRKRVRRRFLRVPLGRFTVASGFDAGAADGLWRRAAPRYPFATIRNARWLGRRFTGRPGVEYRHIAVRGRNAVHAWAVVAAGPGVLRLADLVWDGEDIAALSVLDAELDRLAGRLSCTLLETWLGGDPDAERALEALGWQSYPEPNNLQLVIRSFTDRVDPTAMGARFYLTMGDSDLV